MKKIKLRIVVSFILALILSVMIYSYLTSLSQEVSIYVAAGNIESGTIVKHELLKQVYIGEEDSKRIASAAVKKIDEDKIIVALTDIKDGRIVYEEDLLIGTEAEMRTKGIINEAGKINDEYFIGSNKRLYTVIVDGEGSVGNKITRGSFVDIIYTSEESKKEKSAKMLLENVEVNDVGSVSSTDGQATQAVTLVVTPQQAVKLTYAKRNGTIDFALKSEESKTGITSAVSEHDLGE